MNKRTKARGNGGQRVVGGSPEDRRRVRSPEVTIAEELAGK
jgi:hypothetical protein